MFRKKRAAAGVATQLRDGKSHPFGAVRAYVPLNTEARLYRSIREALPILDAAIGKLVRLSGGFTVRCGDKTAEQGLNTFLQTVPCGRGQAGIHSFLAAYLDSLLTYGKAVGEMVVSGGQLAAVCWGDVTAIQIQEGDSPLDVSLWGPDETGRLRPLPYQHLLLFTTLNPEPGSPYGYRCCEVCPFSATYC